MSNTNSTKTDYKFEGWVADDPTAVDGKMVWKEFEPKPWEETDIDIKVTHCGMCGTDLHFLRNGFGTTPYPITVGHEIVGIAVRVGSKAEGHIKVGDRVGVGAQNDSCLSRFGKCSACAAGEENYCDHFVWTYASTHFNGGRSQGGYATYHRAPSHFVIPIPDGISSRDVAPMMCGGVTMFAPLRAANVHAGMNVGIVGVGGLGHYGIIFAKAMGADKVVGISRKESKRDEILGFRADDYIATDDEKDWVEKHRGTLDLIVCTVASSKVPINDYLKLLKMRGTFVQVGLPDDGPLGIEALPVAFGGLKFAGSCIGSPDDIRAMLDLVVRKHLRGLVQDRPMKDANKAIIDLEQGKARYRYCLVNEDYWDIW